VCTLSVITHRALELRYRVVMNRDERDDRLPARPPAILSFSNVQILAPTDTKAGGTWIAANEQGLTFALMNRTDTTRSLASPATQSRGLIIPAIAHHSALPAARDAARALDWSLFPPCRLTILGQDNNMLRAALLAWSGIDLDVETADIETLCLASSGLGDALVQTRIPLFHQFMKANDGSSPHESQSRFHQHRWLDTPETSVLMSRPAHRTVSITTVDVGPEEVVMTYSDVQRVKDTLDIAPGVVCRLARSRAHTA